jgi:Leucine-rich repeat (LRR) protein
VQNIQTLTYLNLQSNCLTDVGVRALGGALEKKQTLRRLLIDGNHFSPDAAVFTQQTLLRSGAQVTLVWTPAAARNEGRSTADDGR